MILLGLFIVSGLATAPGTGLRRNFRFFSGWIVKKLTKNLARRRALLFVFVMALHNIPDGLSVGFDVAALGWEEALPLSIAIFIQNIPEGFAFAKSSAVQLPLLLSFAGASMMTVVSHEIFERKTNGEKFSSLGFLFGLSLCALLDLFL